MVLNLVTFKNVPSTALLPAFKIALTPASPPQGGDGTQGEIGQLRRVLYRTPRRASLYPRPLQVERAG